MKKKKSATTTSKRDPGVWPGHIPLLALVALFVLVAVGALWPNTYLWGVHSLGYFPLPLRLLALALAALMFVPRVARLVHDNLKKTVGLFAEGKQSLPLMIMVTVIAFVAFIQIDTATDLLGDGELQSGLWERTIVEQELELGAFMKLVWKDFHQTIATGTNMLCFSVGRMSMGMGATTPLTGIIVLFALMGAGLVFTALWFMGRSPAAVEWRIVAVGAMLTTGALQLFFGYFETYVPLLFVSTFYLLACYDTLANQRRWWLPVVLLLVALFINFLALLLAPSLIPVLASRFLKGPSWPKRIGKIVPVLVLAGAAVIRFAPFTSKFFLPFVSDENAHGILSITHAIDIVNEIMLVAPMFPLLLGFSVAYVLYRGSGETPAVTRAGAPWSDTFEATLIAPCALFFFVFRPDLGMPLDWDLFVLPVLCISAVLLMPMHDRMHVEPARQAVVRFTAPAIALGLVIVLPWFAVNTSEELSVKRYNDLVAGDEKVGGYPYEILAMHMRDREVRQESITAWDKAYARERNPRYLIAKSVDYFILEDTLAARETLAHCVEKHYTYERAYQVYLDFLASENDVDEMLRVSLLGAERFPNAPLYPFYLGIGLQARGYYSEAIDAFEKARRLGAPPQMQQAIDTFLRRIQSGEGAPGGG